jgi:hypothetical protein
MIVVSIQELFTLQSGSGLIGFRASLALLSIIFLIAGTSSSEALFLLTYSAAPARRQRNAYWLSA